MICPHRHNDNSRSITCDVALVVGVTQLAGPVNPNYPCDRCRSEWTNDTPPDPADRSSWTPTLLSFIEPLSNPEQLPRNPRGLGDTVALGLHAIGIRKRKGCGCGKRQAWLNRTFPYRNP